MKNFQSVIIVLLFTIINTQINISKTSISSTRNSYASQACTLTLNFSDTDYATTQSYNTKYKNILGTNNNLAKILIENNFNYSSITNLSNSLNLLLFILPHAICMIILIILWPCLCCCCVSPQKYPTMKCCRKEQKQLYTRFQLKWTSYILLFFSLICVGAALTGLLNGNQIVDNYNDINCRLVQTIDNLINGKSSNDGYSFFVGLNPLSNTLSQFSNQSLLNTFFTQANNCFNTTTASIQTNGNTILNQVSSLYTGYSDITYTNAFGSYNNTSKIMEYQNIQSQFKSLTLGPYNDTSKYTITKIIYSNLTYLFNQINSILNPLLDSWNYINSTTLQTVSDILSKGASSISNISNILNNNINSIGLTLYKPTMTSSVKTSISALYGIIFTLSLIILICTIFIAFFSVVRLRLILYCACSFLIFFGFIAFSLCLILITATPLLYQACTYVDSQLLTSTTTNQLLINLKIPQFGSLINECMPGGSQNIIDSIDSTLNDTISNILFITNNTQNFNSLIGNYSSANVIAPFTAGQAMLQTVYSANVLDITDPVALTYLSSISARSFPISSSCISANLNADSWVSSFSTGTCPSGMGHQNVCANLSNTAICPFGCYEILNQFNNTAGDAAYVANLQSRYGGSCPWVNYLIDLHKNWNEPRMNSLASVNTSINSIILNVNSYTSNVGSLQSNLGTFSTILNANFDPIVNTNYGTLNGLSCIPLRESFSNLRDSICVGLYNSMNYNLICITIVSWCICIISCFATCTGVRHYNHLKKMQLTLSYSGVPITLSESKIT